MKRFKLPKAIKTLFLVKYLIHIQAGTEQVRRINKSIFLMYSTTKFSEPNLEEIFRNYKLGEVIF